MVLKSPTSVKVQSPLSAWTSVPHGPPLTRRLRRRHEHATVPLDGPAMAAPAAGVRPEGRSKLGIEKLGMAGIVGILIPPHAMARAATMPSEATLAKRITIRTSFQMLAAASQTAAAEFTPAPARLLVRQVHAPAPFTIAPMSEADLSAVHVVVPLRAIESGKSRLGQALDAEEREVLVLGLLGRTLDVLAAWPPANASTSSPATWRRVSSHGARCLR